MRRADRDKIREAERLLRDVQTRVSVVERAFGLLSTTIWWADEAARAARLDPEPEMTHEQAQAVERTAQGNVRAPATKGPVRPTTRPPGAA
jgi:hypothetical protein